jgi:hypothetical protein
VFKFILLDKYPACKFRPTGVEESATFVISIDRVKNILDLRADDLGVWVHGGIPKSVHKVAISEGDVIVRTLSKAANESGEGVYARHADEGTFKRIVYTVTKDGKRLKRALIQYYFTDGSSTKPIKKSPHGNCKEDSQHSCQPHLRTQTSTIENLKLKAKKQSPKDAIYDELDEVGGILGAISMSEEPRNRRQVYNFKAKTRPEADKNGTDEPYGDLVELTKIVQEHRSRPDKGFAHDLNIGDGNSMVLVNQQQVRDVERFCCAQSGQFCPLGIDGTFDFGPFFITLTTYRQLLLQKDDGTSPVAVGPIFLHQKRGIESYYDFFRSLFKLKSGLTKVRAMGCDGEDALINAIVAAFPDVILLRCFWHAKNNIKDKLRRKFGVNDVVLKQIMTNIFGCQVEATYHLGLVDADDAEDFDRKFASLFPMWEEEVPGFHAWFKKHKSSTFKESIISSVREAAGLGSPPSIYTNNDNEGMNSVLRRMTTSGKKLWSEMVAILEKLVTQQQVEFERAVYGAGEFRLVSEMSRHQKSPGQWHKMSSEQKKNCLKKFNTMECPFAVHDVQDTYTSDEEARSKNELSIPHTKSGISSVNQSTLQDIWAKASQILSTVDGITSAPGQQDSLKCVMSLQGLTPHFVTRDGA